MPAKSFALTGGPAQPEFNSFSPVGTSDMVNLSSGDVKYSIPIMDVGGYPISLSYAGSPTMDQEASFVGLGWNMSVGQINRNVRGIPDDFKGDEMVHKNHVKPNMTVGARFNVEPGVFGFELGDIPGTGGLSVGVGMSYNNYSGFSVSHSAGVDVDLLQMTGGLNLNSGPNGLSISPSLSLSNKTKDERKRMNSLSASFGLSFNSRKGIESTTLNMTRKSVSGKNDSRSYSGVSSMGSTMSFVDNTYTPSIRQKMITGTFTVNAALGSTAFGGEAEGEITAYGSVQALAPSEKEKIVKAYGYENTEVAPKENVALDYNREKDGNFTVNSTNLPITNYTYDQYSIKGEGVAGSFRPRRNQVGFVYDSEVKDLSGSGTMGLEIDAGNAVKFGGDAEGTFSTNRSGMVGGPLPNHILQLFNPVVKTFDESSSNQVDYQKVHYANVGDLSLDREFGLFSGPLNGYAPVRVAYSGGEFNRYMVKNYENSTSTTPLPNNIKRGGRQLTNQAILPITMGDLEKGIGDGPIAYGEISGNDLPSGRQPHHTGEYQITRNDGARYVYGLPAYNNKKVETTFSVEASNGNCSTGLVSYLANVDNTSSNSIGNQYFNEITTPGYAHTYLLTSVLSTDYQDKGVAGPSQDDLGSYTKFSYVKKGDYKWRVPFQAGMATYNEGLKTDETDDKGNYTYGEKELYYVDEIETKTHKAKFWYSPRKDAYGVKNENGGLDQSQKMYKLDSVQLFSLPEYEEAVQAGDDPTPIKTAHLVYNYDLCKNVPNNEVNDPSVSNLPLTENELSNNGGKLTLKKVYFTYRHSKMGKYAGYTFNYDSSNPDRNPNYNHRGYDVWGNFKPNTIDNTPPLCGVLEPVTAPEFKYTEQTSETDEYAQAWTLQQIELPSGGMIDFEYEADDYAFVQDKDVNKMFKVLGAGTEQIPNVDPTAQTDYLYQMNFNKTPNQYLYVEVDENYASDPNDFYNNFIAPMENSTVIRDGDPNDTYSKKLMYFRFLLNMSKNAAVNMPGQETPESNLDEETKFDYVSGYIEVDKNASIGLTSGSSGHKIASIPIKLVEKGGGVNPNALVNPISKAGWNFGRKYLNRYIYSTSPNGPANPNTIKQIADELVKPQLISNLLEIFQGPNGRLRDNFIASRFVKDKSWVRMVDPSGKKKGGGSRVKEVIMSDIWEDMTGNTNHQTMNYGQVYKYELEPAHELENDETPRSSGVATYEPIGSKENPFVKPVISSIKHMLAPDEENYVEEPFGESFFPSPQVTYSRVTVHNRQAGVNPDQSNLQLKALNKTGHVVHGFYTSKDYPTITDQTELNAIEDKNEVLNLLDINRKKSMSASQGFVIHTNDMNGKQKSQRVYAEGQQDAISGVDYYYDNVPVNNDPTDPFALASRNAGRLDNNVTVIMPDGSIKNEVLGVEYDVINDFREKNSSTKTIGVNLNVNGFIAGIIPGIVPAGFPDFSSSQTNFQSVTTTKVIHTYGILRETVAHDAGASVYTKNLAWDGVTGEVLVTETVDEYGDKYYTLNYPAHWYYDGMGVASKNLNLNGTLIASGGNTYSISGTAPFTSDQFLTEGDKLAISDGINSYYGWVINLNGNDFDLIDKDGNSLTGMGGSNYFIIRSGRRNLQSAGVFNVTTTHNPLEDLQGDPLFNLHGNSENNLTNPDPYLMTDTSDPMDIKDWEIIEAGAVDYSDMWTPPCECGSNVGEDVYNPYTINERGVWRTKSSHTYLTGRNNADTEPTPRVEGYYTSFSPFYQNTGSGGWIKDYSGWTFTQEVSIFSPYGFELENKDALDRYSAAQYGYNNTMPMAVGANTRYSEIGFDGFEDYGFEGCDENQHFSFKNTGIRVVDEEFHTGRHSSKVSPNSSSELVKNISCNDIICDVEITDMNFNYFLEGGGRPVVEVTPTVINGIPPYQYSWTKSNLSTGVFDTSFSIQAGTETQEIVRLTSIPQPNSGDELHMTLTITDSEGCQVTSTYFYVHP